ncbi:CCR4-NOT transcription complex subunit 6 [Pancytospora epiphaga]|nr:CCR4-NOT transcription complex subunit 6 [Pancytospora epiphaga]
MEEKQEGKMIAISEEKPSSPPKAPDAGERRHPSKGAQACTERLVGLDLSSQGLKSLSSSLFLLSNIRELLLCNNSLEVISKDICKMRSLEKLNLSFNKIRTIPPEIGRMVWLRELHLNDNFISAIPVELGSLCGLEVLNLNNNPLVPPFCALNREKTLIHYCRENNAAYTAPSDRAWVDTVLNRAPHGLYVSIGTYNILCNFYAAKCTYAPTWVLNAEARKETILQNIISYNVDILCLQEIETYAFFDFYREQLEIRLGYDGTFLPKGRSQTLADKRSVDGCATFWKKGKFKLVEQINVDFFNKITTDIRFSLNQSILVRHARKDNIALITVLEHCDGVVLIVVNLHLYWDPEYADVKLFQTVLVLEEIERAKNKFPGASVILAGDFNSLVNSYVYNLIVGGKLDPDGFNLCDYSPLNSGFEHSTPFYDSYNGQDLLFTNFTPTFKGVIDYIFYSDGLQLTSVLSPLEDEYTENTVGLPNIHFPSDHIFIGARFGLSSSSSTYGTSR